MRFDECTLVLEHEVIENGHLVIEDGTLVKLGHGPLEGAQSLTGCTIFPGFIDMHVHGTNGADFMDAQTASIDTILEALVKEGTTALLATTMTESFEVIERALTMLGNHTPSLKGAQLLGIHLEGPFLNKTYRGAQNAEQIIPGDLSLFNRWQALAKQRIKCVTLAPEVQSPAFIEALVKQGIIVSMGHTDATHDEVVAAREQGVRRVTHCYNAMRGLHHRDMGVVGAALLYDDMEIELIADLHHVSVPALQLAAKLKRKRIQLVTDSVSAKHMPEGQYQLGGQNIRLQGDTVRTETGALAGSILSLPQAAKHMDEHTQLSLPDLAHALSGSAAEALGLAHERGKIACGMRADLTILDSNFEVMMTLINGKIVYQKAAIL